MNIIINKRYQISRKIWQNRFFEIYEARDLKNENLKRGLVILNDYNVPNRVIDFLKEDFNKFKGFETPHINRVLEFSLIDDFTKNKKRQYFYVQENILTEYNLKEESNNLEVWTKIAKALNHLHLRGMEYRELYPKNIGLTLSGGLMLKDLVTVRLESHISSITKSEIEYRAPELLIGQPASRKADIFALGTLMNKMLEDEENEEQYKKYLNLIKYMRHENQEKRMENLKEFFIEIEKINEKEYPQFDFKIRKKLNLDGRIIGRDSETSQAIKLIEDVSNKKYQKLWIGIYGEAGVGKTRFLKHLEEELKLKGIKVYSSYNLERNSLENVATPIIKKMIDSYSAEEILKKEEDFKNIITFGVMEKMSDYIFYSQVNSFIKDLVRENVVVFIVDNIENADEFSTKLLQYIYHQRNENERLVIIHSSKEELEKNREVSLLETNRIEIENLNESELGIFVKNVLGAKSIPKTFTARLYHETEGNLKFTEDILKYLQEREIIYIDKKTGGWLSDVEYADMPFPESIDEAFIEFFNSLEESNKAILQIIASHQGATCKKTIEALISAKKENINNSILELVEKRVINRKLDQIDEVYNFCNSTNKRITYEKMDKEKRKKYHKEITDILEAIKKPIDIGTLEREMLYQYEAQGNYEKALNIAFLHGQYLKDKGLKKDSLKILKRAYYISEILEKEEEKQNIHLVMAKVFFEIGFFEEAISELNEAIEISMKNKDFILVLNILKQIGELYIVLKEFEKGEVILKKMEEASGFLQEKQVGNKIILEYKAHLESVKGNATIALKLTSELSRMSVTQGEIGRIDYIKSISYGKKGDIEKAKEHIEKAISIFEAEKKYNWVGFLYCTIGRIEFEYEENFDSAIFYFEKAQKISMDHNLTWLSAISLSNITEAYLNKLEFEKAEENLKKAQAILADTHGMTFLEIFLKLVRFELNIEKFEYKKAIEIIDNLNVDKYISKNTFIAGIIHRAKGVAYLVRGRFEESLQELDLALEIYRTSNSMYRWDCEALKQLIYISVDFEEEGENLLGSIRKRTENYKSDLKKSKVIRRFITADKVKKLIISGEDYSLKELVREYAEKFSKSENIKVFQRGIYMKFLVSDISQKNILGDELKKSLIGTEDFFWDFSIDYGDYKKDLRDYEGAFESYMEALLHIRQLGEEFKTSYEIDSFLKDKNLKKTFEKISYLYENLGIETTESKEFVELLRGKTTGQLLRDNSILDFIRSEFIKKLEEKKLLKVESLYDFFAKFESDSNQFFQIANYLKSVFIATGVAIISNEKDMTYTTIEEIGIEEGKEKVLRPIVEYTKSLEKNFSLSKILGCNDEELKLLKKDGIKTFLCIPIFQNSKMEETKIQGFLYIESKNIINDISESAIKKAEPVLKMLKILFENENLKKSSYIDSLTGSYNRMYFEDQMIQLATKKNFREKFTLGIIDLDYFKKVNDTYGHQVGDNALRAFSKVIKEMIKKDDIFCRYGGEEFVVILKNIESKRGFEIFDSIREEVNSKVQVRGEKISVSIGIASYPEDTHWPEELLGMADKALYSAKENGRNKVAIWNKSIEKNNSEKNSLMNFISSDIFKESQNRIYLMEILSIFKRPLKKKVAIKKCLKILSEAIRAEQGILLTIDKNMDIEKSWSYTKETFEQNIDYLEYVNTNIIEKVISIDSGVVLIDWEKIAKVDIETGIPQWNSVICVPIYKEMRLKGILYFTSGTKNKEFNSNDYNLVDKISPITAILI